MIWFLFLVVIMLFALAAGAFFAPYWNKLFGKIWQDPRERERDELRKRLLEVHVRSGLPPETAAMLVAKEVGGTEEELLEAAQVLGAEGIRRLASGRTSILERMFFGLSNSFYRGSGRR